MTTNKLTWDFILLGCVYICIAIGIWVLYSQEAVLEKSSFFWTRQVSYAALGTILLIFARSLNYHSFLSYSVGLYFIMLFLLVLTLVPGIGKEINGARSWIYIGNIGFQTSEFAKLSTILLLANYLSIKEREMHLLYSLILPFLITLVPMLLILAQPDFGSAFILFLSLLLILIIAGADLYHIGSVITFGVLMLVIPFYVEYHNIILVEHLVDHFENLGENGGLASTRILRSQVWDFIDKLAIPASTSLQDSNYLQGIARNEAVMAAMKSAAATVRYEFGGLILVLLDKTRLLLGIGVLLFVSSLSLLAFRLARGVIYAHLRKFYIPLGIFGISLIGGMVILSTFSFHYHQVARITAFISPDKFPRDLAYQTRTSKIAIGSGVVLGKGMHGSELTVGYRPLVPEANTDFIFSSWAERTGFLGSLLLLFSLAGIVIRGLIISLTVRDKFCSLLASSICILFFSHILVNIGISLGLIPVTGIPLTFVSYGGSHLVVSLTAIGMLMSIYRLR